MQKWGLRAAKLMNPVALAFLELFGEENGVKKASPLPILMFLH